MPNKEFLEEYPLYRKFAYEVGSSNPIPSINFKCEECNSLQTFIAEQERYQRDTRLSVVLAQVGFVREAANELSEYQESDFIENLTYTCASCNKSQLFIYLHFSPTNKYVEKIGQFPSWSIDISPELEKALGDLSNIYKKGLICESISYGIGAFAYYRRIVECIIDDLLEDLTELVSVAEKEIYIAALKKVKESKVAKDKIKIVKELLPESLRPAGKNPLGLIHDSLSEGLHIESDEVCLEYAGTIRVALTYLVDQIYRTKKDKASFTKSISKLLDKKSDPEK